MKRYIAKFLKKNDVVTTYEVSFFDAKLADMNSCHCFFFFFLSGVLVLSLEILMQQRNNIAIENVLRCIIELKE